MQEIWDLLGGMRAAMVIIVSTVLAALQTLAGALNSGKTIADVVKAIPERWTERKAEEVRENKEYADQIVELAKLESAQNIAKVTAITALFAIQCWAIISLAYHFLWFVDHAASRRSGKPS
jgi:hypothetical protein